MKPRDLLFLACYYLFVSLLLLFGAIKRFFEGGEGCLLFVKGREREEREKRDKPRDFLLVPVSEVNNASELEKHLKLLARRHNGGESL